MKDLGQDAVKKEFRVSIALCSAYQDRDVFAVLSEVHKNKPGYVTLGVQLHFDGYKPSKELVDKLTAAFFIEEQSWSAENLGQIESRNSLARRSMGNYILFLDDDLEAVDVEWAKILGVFQPNVSQVPVLAIRGRVLPTLATEQHPPPMHWDLGPLDSFHQIDLEGLSIWDKTAFLEAGGFKNPCEEGVAHEGIDVTHRLLIKHGPRVIRYCPDLFARRPVGPSALENQRILPNRLTSNENLNAQEVARFFAAFELEASSRQWPVEKIANVLQDQPRFSLSVIITTNRLELFQENFLNCLAAQSDKDFQLVLIVDDPQADLEHYLSNQMRDRIGCSEVVIGQSTEDLRGRGASLNLGCTMANGDYLLVWDDDDWYFSNRISWTRERISESHASGKPLDLISGGLILDKGINSSFLNFPVESSHGKQRFLWWMLQRHSQVAFPTVAFSRRLTQVPFRTDVKGAVDLTWITDVMGLIIHVATYTEPVALYRRHPEAITALHSESQKSNAALCYDHLLNEAVEALCLNNKDPVESLEITLASVRKSMSWRITAPLRKADVLRIGPKVSNWLSKRDSGLA